MPLAILLFILFGMIGLLELSLLQKIKSRNYEINLEIQTEVKQPFNPNLMPKALTIEDLNNIARNYCNRALAIVIQCIEEHINNPSVPLSPFCRDVINNIQAGRDLTTDVQYLWEFLPNIRGTLYDEYTYSSTTTLLSVRDLPRYIRQLWKDNIPPVYQTYFWTLPTSNFYYHKPEDDRNPTPCAYSGVIIPP